MSRSPEAPRRRSPVARPLHRARPTDGRSAPAALLAALLLALVTPPVRAQSTDADAPVADVGAADDVGAAQFALLCARCHGLAGDGKGAEVLDRPARDFTAGGFSFGNTIEAISRTVSFGIPGTPMPSFGEALEPDVVEALARHVRTLAHVTEDATEEETILRVDDRPVALRGGLPPITEDAPAHPRGLLLGLPGGLTFEYRVPDLALLGVRLGDLAKRTDWTGRGGSTLEPLGRVVWLNGAGAPDPMTWASPRGPTEPVTAELRAIRTPASGATLTWDALAPDGTLLARVTEHVAAVSSPLGAGFARTLVVDGLPAGRFDLFQAASPGAALVEYGKRSVVAREEGGVELVTATWRAGDDQTDGEVLFATSPRGARLAFPSDGRRTFTLLTLWPAAWEEPATPEQETQLRATLDAAHAAALPEVDR